MRSKLFPGSLLCTVLLVCGACGQQGPLYLPEEKSGSADMVGDEGEPRKQRGTSGAPASDTEAPVTQPDPDRPNPSTPTPPQE